MTHGVVVGKFYPPHAGHHYLIDSAKKRSDHVTVIVIEQDGQVPAGYLREAWLREAHPDVTVILVPDIYDDDSAQAWADYTIEILGEKPDVVFTSETYGEDWAKRMKCRHVLVDLERVKLPVSGTKVRNDPLAYWQYIDHNVRAFYTKRISIVGAESTGTTTLAKALAQHFGTTWVPEYGRWYTEGKILAGEGAAWRSEEFEFIADQQNRLEDQLAKYSSGLLVCDTDSFATAVWHERYMGYLSQKVANYYKDRSYDLYLLTAPDIPFEQDGMREGGKGRLKMHDRFIELLKHRGIPFVVIDGDDFPTRLKLAVEECEKVLGLTPSKKRKTRKSLTILENQQTFATA